MVNLILCLIQGPLRARESLILENVSLLHRLQILSRGENRPALKNHQPRTGLVVMLGTPNVTLLYQIQRPSDSASFGGGAPVLHADALRFPSAVELDDESRCLAILDLEFNHSHM